MPNKKYQDKKKYIAELEEIIQNMNWPEQWYNDAYNIWKEIAIDECIEYFVYIAFKHHIKVEVGDRTYTIFDFLLNNFSTSQIYNLIWQSIKDVTAYSVRENLTIDHTRNLLIGALQRRADKSIADGWNIKGFNRNYDCPQSIISSTFFDSFLKIGDDGFNQVPTDIFSKIINI